MRRAGAERSVLLLRALSILGFIEGAWMAFDGIRALVVGDYVRIGGQLGPWAMLLDAIGIDPLSFAVRIVFVVLGIAWIGASILLAAGIDAGRTLTVTMAILTLWYVPVGTAFSILQLIALVAMRPR